jgi:hypothetical protein
MFAVTCFVGAVDIQNHPAVLITALGKMLASDIRL